MTPIEATESLEAINAVGDADNAGVYALSVAVPNSVEAVQRQWLATHGTPIPDQRAEQLAAAERVVYVGKTGRKIRERIEEHAAGKVRKASLLQAFDTIDVYGVYPGAHTGVAERNRARKISTGKTVAYANGELF